MKKILISVLVAFSVGGVAVAEDAVTLDSMLDERIRLNKVYGEKFSKEAEGLDQADKLVPLEKKLGKEWVDFLKYVRNSGDPILKVHVLKLEYMDELSGCYYDLEYAEGVLERVALNAHIANWKEKLELLEKITGEKAEEKQAKPTE